MPPGKSSIFISFDAVRGNVIHLTSNFTPFAVGESLRYHWRGGQADREETDDIIQRISLTEMRFLQRSQFDEIQYGSAMQKRHARGNILRPVIAAHGHFKLLSQRFPEVKTHVIAHECFYAARRSLPGRRFFVSGKAIYGMWKKR